MGTLSFGTESAESREQFSSGAQGPRRGPIQPAVDPILWGGGLLSWFHKWPRRRKVEIAKVSKGGEMVI